MFLSSKGQKLFCSTEHIINNYLIKESISIRSMVYEKQYCIVCIQFFREKQLYSIDDSVYAQNQYRGIDVCLAFTYSRTFFKIMRF